MPSYTGEQTQFKYFYDALVNKFPGLATADGSTVFQFATVPYAAEWVDGTLESIYNSANITSAGVGGFLTPESGTFYNGYSTLITSLKVPDSTSNKDYTHAQTMVANVANELNVILLKAHSAYSNWKAQNQSENGTVDSFGKWLASVDGFQYNSEILAKQSELTTLRNQLAKITKTMNGAIGKAQADLSSDQIGITPLGGESEQVPRFGISGNLSQDKTNWDSYDADTWDLDITINSKTVVKSDWKILYDQSVEQKCLTTKTRNKINTSRIIQDKAFSLNFKSKGAEAYNIVRGGWYFPTFVNPSVALEPNIPGVNTQSVFGLHGPMHLVPETLVVLYKPSMTLTTTTETYEQYIGAHADADVNWLDIFGFRFDIGQNSGIKKVSGPKTTTIEMPIPGDSTPQVFGVNSKVAFAPPS